jgi:ribosome-binding protein aMBF1 (putative translation factor)
VSDHHKYTTAAQHRAKPKRNLRLGRLSDMNKDVDTLRKKFLEAALAERIGKNIAKFKKECSWSFETLAAKTGIDRTTSLSHVHGKSKPHPKTLKEYAQAFSKELKRQITVNDLEK